ncbi:hypothetical protein HYPBUDRAFT_154482 [Hyphopichia burtonii NRRL Y-1933]|uniref:Uncharacterized protein n=1 Tax=Hyphopichia burtonii NRRL Y-1933 TaxID=984485 RepID=A0A1E4RQ67_9ASCO|nr:hypothetical protein HYPBUDRAFT_154482 [Hyphopichia burtonii NRRL Y-1933]ODV69420.1 hypothetical protein HYPBUDRAFT_154482 [Hyphopichia burtonii NRRL Y-1933]
MVMLRLVRPAVKYDIASCGIVSRASSIRWQSTGLKPTSDSTFNPNSIYVVSFPITTHKSYIYCNHEPSLLAQSQLSTYPILTKVETKITGLALKAWNKLKLSELEINKKITKLVYSLLNTVPYDESCLTSFPSQSSMIREINKEVLSNNEKVNTMVQSQIDHLKIPQNQLKPIPLYHPTFQHSNSIIDQLKLFKDDSYAKHMKYAILCGIGVPISLPLAIIPLVPNVPGLYLAYRLYCNVKLLMGAKHLDYLLQDDQHLLFKPQGKIDAIYRLDNFANELLDQSEVSKNFDEEKVLITEDIIEGLVSHFHLHHLKSELIKAMNQESKRINQNLKVNDIVE